VETLTQAAPPTPPDAPEANPHGLFVALRKMVPKSEVFRYLIVGGWNTVFALVLYSLCARFFGRTFPAQPKWLVADLGYVLSTPISITMSFFCYKHFVFRTQGNYLKEWLRCFAVYSVSFPVGLVVVPAATQFFLYFPSTHSQATNLGGLVNSAVIATYSYFGHKKFSFKK
jgi:putative flippase GtrA